MIQVIQARASRFGRSWRVLWVPRSGMSWSISGKIDRRCWTTFWGIGKKMSETSLKLWGRFLDVSSSSKLQFFFRAFFFVRCGDVRRSVWGDGHWCWMCTWSQDAVEKAKQEGDEGGTRSARIQSFTQDLEFGFGAFWSTQEMQWTWVNHMGLLEKTKPVW